MNERFENEANQLEMMLSEAEESLKDDRRILKGFLSTSAQPHRPRGWGTP